MKRQTQLEKAIASINADIAVLEAARDRLLRQQREVTVRKPRAVKAKPETAA